MINLNEQVDHVFKLLTVNFGLDSACFEKTGRTHLDALSARLAGIMQQREVHTRTHLLELRIAGQCAIHGTLLTSHTGTTGEASFNFL